MPIMTLVHSGYQHRLDLTSYSIPFVSDTGLVRDSINDILCLVQPRYDKSLFTRSRDIHPRDLVTRCAPLWMESHRVGPEYLSITWIDKSRSCNNTPVTPGCHATVITYSNQDYCCSSLLIISVAPNVLDQNFGLVNLQIMMGVLDSMYPSCPDQTLL